MPGNKLGLAGMWATPVSSATGWRMPGAAAGAAYTFKLFTDITRMCEGAKMDSLLFADSNVLRAVDLSEKRDISMERQHQSARLEASALIAALAAVTSRISLIATGTTTYNEPCNHKYA